MTRLLLTFAVLLTFAAPGQAEAPPPVPPLQHIFPVLEFESTPISVVVSFLRETSGANIVLVNKTGTDPVVTGLHARQVSLDQVLQILRVEVMAEYRVVPGSGDSSDVAVIVLHAPGTEVCTYDLGPAIARVLETGPAPRASSQTQPAPQASARPRESVLHLLGEVAHQADPSEPDFTVNRETGLMIVTASPPQQQAIKQALETLAPPKPKEDPQVAQLKEEKTALERDLAALGDRANRLIQEQQELRQQLDQLRQQYLDQVAQTERLKVRLEMLSKGSPAAGQPQ